MGAQNLPQVWAVPMAWATSNTAMATATPASGTMDGPTAAACTASRMVRRAMKASSVVTTAMALG